MSPILRDDKDLRKVWSWGPDKAGCPPFFVLLSLYLSANQYWLSYGDVISAEVPGLGGWEPIFA